MNDRELLKWAARAFGFAAIDFLAQDHWANVYDEDGRQSAWNPLTDDGDALRLAVTLDFNVYHAGASVYVEDLDEGVEIRVGHEGDKFAATRKAIVLGAAEIGRSM